MSFNDHAIKPISEKITTAWIQPKERIIANWVDTLAPIYSISTNYYVINVFVDATALTEASSASLNTGEFYYDNVTSTLHVRLSDDTDPSLSFTVAHYRLFYSDKPIILEYDLSTGRDVEYEGLIKNIGSFKHELDSDDLTGVALSGKGTITLENSAGSFDAIYDKLFWEGAEVFLYAYSDLGTQIIYKGTVDTKSYSSKEVKFKVKDIIDRLRDEVPLEVFASSTGTPDTLDFTPKRRIYGRVSGLQTVSLDQTLDTDTLTGTFSGTKDGKTITGIGSNLLKELSPKDIIKYIQDEDEYTLKVELINSDTEFTVSEEIERTFADLSADVEYIIPYRYNNRKRFIASHEIKQPVATILIASQLNRLQVTDIADLVDFEAGDDVIINGTTREIRRISNDVVILNTNLPSLPVPTDTITKAAIQSVSFNGTTFLVTRDYVVTNTSECYATLTDDAEVNITRPILFNNNTTFTNSSRSVSGTGFDVLKTRDWIKQSGTDTYYEILQVESDTALKLRIPYAGLTDTEVALYKRVDYIDDENIVYVNCLGKKSTTGDWITTGAEVVKDLLVEAGLEDELDVDSFTAAASDAPYLISLALPLEPMGKKPIIRDVIDLINVSVFGSLYYNNDYEITYKVLTPKKPTITTVLRDDDIRSFSATSTGKNVVKTISSKYRFMDYFHQIKEMGNLSYQSENEFVSNISGIKRIEEIDLYLYKASEVTIITQRYGLLKETPNTVLNIKGNFPFITKSLNEVVYFELDRLWDRFGTDTDNNSIGVVSRVSKSGSTADITITDLSGMYNKSCVIAENTANIYGSSDIRERSTTGYITDNVGIVNDNQFTYKTNLIT